MSECVICEETVTNPLCMDCVNTSMQQWLNEKGLPNLTINSFGTCADKCIRCKNPINVCLYCHTKQVFEILQSQKVPKEILTEFLDFFHFDLDKKGYAFNQGLI